MNLSELTFTAGARYEAKRKGRGLGSGKAKTAVLVTRVKNLEAAAVSV